MFLEAFLMTESGQSTGRGKPRRRVRARHRVDDGWRGPFPVTPACGVDDAMPQRLYAVPEPLSHSLAHVVDG